MWLWSFSTKSIGACIVLLALSPLAKADLDRQSEIPIYHYFYPCSSGLVDCVNFQRNNHNYYGDFGMNGAVPTNWSGSGPYGFQAYMSNQRGDVLGYFDAGTGSALVYGYGGVVTCIPGFCEDSNEPFNGINASGLYVFSQLMEGACVGRGATSFGTLGVGHCGGPNVLDLWNYDTSLLMFASRGPMGINDQNQILIEYILAPGGKVVQGVLSPNPIPEPATVALVGAILLAAGWTQLRKRSSGASR